MTTDWIALGSAPISEPTCYNNEDWTEKYSREVLSAWLNQLRRTFPDYKSRLLIKSVPGAKEISEYFVVITFENCIQFEEAKEVADDIPYCWDDKAKEELGALYFKETREIICNKTTINPHPSS